VLLASLAVAGCGESGHPDTGYGADQTLPSTVNCADMCQRSTDCGGHLCAEDTGKEIYIEMFSALKFECESECTSDTLAKITSTTWTCLFKSSCRQIFEDDACHMQAYYHCQ
jgi:hypothetical protein